MRKLLAMLGGRRGRGGFDWTDWFSYGYLVLGLLLMFGPVLWLVLSSFKTPAALTEFPPQLLPYGQRTVVVSGHDKPLPLYRVTLPDGTTRVTCKRKGLRVTLTVGAKKGGGLMRRLAVSPDPVVMLDACLQEAARAAGVQLQITDTEILITP